MQILNLDKNLQITADFFSAFPREQPIKQIKFSSFTFPSGCEPHIKIDPTTVTPGQQTVITCRINSMNDFMMVLLATDALKRLDVKADNIMLFIPFLPFARQDRVCDEGEAFSLKIIADLINSQGYGAVRMYDSHSEIAPALINNSIVVPNHDFVASVLYGHENIGLENAVVVAPDFGATKKIYKTMSAIMCLNEVIVCDKVRDLKTGKIMHYKVYAEDLTGKTCYVIDDICDGGVTFLMVAAALRAKGASRVVLIVSFGIFSKGVDCLLDAGIDKIYTTQLFKEDYTISSSNLDRLVRVELSEI